MPQHMTAKEAATHAGCSVSTLKRYQCAWCEQPLYNALTGGCGAIYEKCDPADKPFYPWKCKPRKEASNESQ